MSARPLTERQRRMPTVRGVLSDDGAQVAIRCPFCAGTHWHGAAPGHRVAHCRQGDGYVIVLPSATVTGDGWGRWSLDRELCVLRHPRYEVDLEKCLTPAAVLDWIAQVAGKTWGDRDATLAGLVRALDDVLHLQATLCPCGVPGRLTKTEVHRRCRTYTAGPT